MKTVRLLLAPICLFLLLPLSMVAQEEEAAVYQGKRYIDLRLKAMEKFNKQAEKQQEKLLRKLQKQEKKFARSLKRKDSAAHAKYQQQQPTFASIRQKNKPDSATLHGKTANKRNGAVDSLKNVSKFVENNKKALEEKAHVTGEDKGNNAPSGAYNGKLQEQNAKLNYRKHISELVSNRTKALKEINASAKGNVKGFKAIDKNVFYSNAKVSTFKQVMEEPSLAEDKAFEFLQGQEGFDQYLRGDNDMAALNGMSSSQLEKMGYQTKQQLTQNLQKKFGGNLGGLQESMGKQVEQFNKHTKKLEDIRNKANKAKQAKQTARNAKSSARNLRYSAKIDKPTFKVNPMRGKPFSQRIEKQFNWQTNRPTLNGKPAIFQLSAMAGFRHTEKLTYGIGIAPAIGLGSGWNDIHLSFQGIGLRTYTTWELLYGFGLYGGYERMYKQAAFLDTKEMSAVTTKPHDQQNYNESLLIGLTKKYRITDKWSGSIQLLCDIWYKDKGLRSPIQIRFATMTN